MSWGFTATNKSGQVLASSETRNLHFIGQATFHAQVRYINAYGGIRRWTFRIACNAVPMPFFTMPTQDYYAVSAVREISPGSWEIEVIRSGYSDLIPEVFVFADPRGVTRGPDTNYGVRIMRDDGTPSFDSRLSPLTVTGGLAVVPPSNPRAAGPGYLNPDYCSTDASPSLAPDTKNIYSLPALYGTAMMFYPSIAQAQRQFEVTRSWQECTGVEYGVCIGYSEVYRTWSVYWAFYRSGIKRIGTELHCGWIAVEYGCNWYYKKGSSFLGIDTGGNSGSGGSWPYSNETLNLTPTAVITANADRYRA